MKLQNAIAGLAVLAMVSLVATTAQAGGACCAGKKATQTSGASGPSHCTDKAMKAGGGVCTGVKTALCNMTPAECEQWMRTHYKDHGWLGVTMNCETAQPTITHVADDSPAQKAGFQVGDVLTSINGVEFTAENEAKVSEIMQNGFKIGEKVKYTASRNGETVKLTAKLVKVDDAMLNQMIATHVADMHKAGDKADNVN